MASAVENVPLSEALPGINSSQEEWMILYVILDQWWEMGRMSYMQVWNTPTYIYLCLLGARDAGMDKQD